jgi:predicted nucleic acid-binding protein
VKQFLLDTNVLSEMSRPRPAPTVVTWLRNIPLDAMFLSDVVIAEIRFGTENIGNSARRDSLLNWLKNDVRPSFAGRILPVTEDIFVRWRWIVETNRRKGHTFEQSDALLAATAVHHNLTVVTRDIKPFERSEVACLDPWQPQ